MIMLPIKVPATALRTIEEAGKQRVPFTTGLLIGIGETLEDRVDTPAGHSAIYDDCYGPHPGSNCPELSRQAHDPDG